MTAPERSGWAPRPQSRIATWLAAAHYGRIVARLTRPRVS